jgi:hypothetical protein
LTMPGKGDSLVALFLTTLTEAGPAFMAFEWLGCTTQELLASTPEAAVYTARHDREGAVVLVVFRSRGGREGVRKHLPERAVGVHELGVRHPPPALEGRKWGLVVQGPARMTLLVDALWEWGRSPDQQQEGEARMHYSHQIAAALVSRVWDLDVG